MSDQTRTFLTTMQNSYQTLSFGPLSVTQQYAIERDRCVTERRIKHTTVIARQLSNRAYLRARVAYYCKIL